MDTIRVGPAIDPGPLSAVTLDVAVQPILRVDGEPFEFMGNGYGGELAVRARFGKAFRAGLATAFGSHADSIGEGRARTLDLFLSMALGWGIGEFGIAAGPVAGLARLSRHELEKTLTGWVAGGRVDLDFPLRERLTLTAGAQVTWSVFPDPPFIGRPTNPNRRVFGRRQRFYLGVGYALWTREEDQGEAAR
jgi:hypothetical protein